VNAVSCKDLFSNTTLLESADLAKLYENAERLFERDTQVVARMRLSPDGKTAYARRGPIGPIETLNLLSVRDSRIIIKTFDQLIKDGELRLLMNLIYKIYQLYKMPERNFRSFMVSAYGKNTVFGRMNRKWHVLEEVLDHYRVVRSLSQHLTLDSLEWITPKSLRRHYRKHVIEGREFSFANSDEYDLAAKDFWSLNNFVTITLSPLTGHFIRYNYMTYEFSVIRDGKIITYFRMTEEYRPENEFDSYIATDLLSAG
jgi:hypothetical protein